MIKLKELREKQGLTQEQVAKLLNLHTTQYCRYEREESELKTSIIIKICKLYKVSADYLLDIKNTTGDYENYEKKCSKIFVQYTQRNNEIKR